MLAGMNWRAGLTIVLLLAAIVCGWSVWTYSGGGADAKVSTRSDYVLHDFELVSLDSQGKESFTLRGPRLQRDPGAKSMTLDTPVFQVPDRHGNYWDVRALRGLVPDDGKQLQLRWKTEGDKPFPMPVQVRVGDKVLDVAMTGGRGHLDLPAGATYTLDPHSRVLRELPHIAEFQKDTAERAKAAAKKR